MMRPKFTKFISVCCCVAMFAGSAFPVAAAPDDSDVAADETALVDADDYAIENVGAAAQTSSGRQVDLTKRVTLDLRSMDVIDALKYIGLRSGMNIVTSKQVTGSVSFQIQNVPIGDILDITLLTNNLAYEKIGEIYYIMTAKEYQERYGKEFSDAREVKIFHLRYAVPQKAFDLLDTLKSSIGRILVDQESATVMIMDTPEKIAQMEQALETMEKKGNVRVFQLQYANAKAVQDQLRYYVDDKKIGSVVADERNNQVVVETLPERMEEIERLIASLDKKTKEVMIDAKIIKIRLSDEFAQEFKWEGLFQKLTDGTFVGSHPFSPVFRTGQTFIDDFTEIAVEDANPAAGLKSVLTESVFLGRVNAATSYELFINFLQTLGETKLISNPKLAVVNNQEAKIHVGRKEAYVTTTTTTGQTTSTTAEQVTFIDIGIQLSVTPTINDDGYITMKVKPEISSVVDTLETPSGNQIPIVDTSMSESTVLVRDNCSIVIGGLRREDETNSHKRVPGLGSIPILGMLFSSKVKTKERSELLVMITPRIIEGNALVMAEENKAGEVKDYRNYHRFDFRMDDAEAARLGKDHPLELKNFKDYNATGFAGEDWPNQINFKSYRR